MALNVKVLLDPKYYYQKLRELTAKSKENFSNVGSDIAKVFSSVREQIRGSDKSVTEFANQIVLAGGVFALLQKGAATLFQFLDMGMKNAKERFLDFFNSFREAADTYAAYEKQQQQLSSENTSALEKMAELQLTGPQLNHTQQEEQRQAIEMLRKSYRGLKVDIDGATGKIKNFEEIQKKVLAEDQQKELRLIQQQIKMLEKQNNIGQREVQYKGGLFSEYWENLKETYGWGAAQEIGGARKANVDKLMELRWREFNLKYKDRAGDAAKMFSARKKDAAEQENNRNLQIKLAAAEYSNEQINKLTEQLQIQTLLNQGLEDAARRQQIVNELKHKGLEYDREAVEKILELNQKLGAIKLQNAQKKEAESLYGRALRAMGRKQEADESDALKRAKEQKGSELTDAEKASTLKLLHLTSQLEGLGSTNRMDFAVQTNALTARGGFQTGVRSRDDALTQYNNQMMNLSKNHLRVAEEIRQHLDNMMGD